MIDPPVEEDAFFLAFNLRDYEGDLWVDGRKLDRTISRRGNFTIYDFRRTWLADMKSAFDGLGFHIPRSALTMFEEDLGGRHIDVLNAKPGKDIEDEVVRGLVRAFLPSIGNAECASRLFQDHVAAILTFHICATYGSVQVSKPASSGLAPWQKKRALDLLEANLSDDPPLSEVARACGLSQGHFTRAFRFSVGHPPYRWVILRRIEKAKDLLCRTDMSIAEIAVICGFCDQAHLTRTMSARLGMSPSQWRRASR